MKKTKIYKANTTSGIQLFDNCGVGRSYLKNMELENGMVKKRNGWRTLYNFRGYSYDPHRINGIYEFKGQNKACLLVHAADCLYECSYDLKEMIKIPCEADVTIVDERSNGQMYGGVLWIMGMGQLLIYDGTSVRRVQNGPLCYVPVTSRSIRDKKLYLPCEKGEDPSLLTARRINRLRGAKSEIIMHSFLLDAPVKYGAPFRLTASFRVRKSTDEENELTTDYIGIDKNGNEINTVVYIELYTDSIEEGVELISNEKPVDKYGRSVSIGENFRFLAYVRNKNELILAFDAVAHDSGEDNIEVEFTEDGADTTSLDMVQDISVVALKGGGNVAAISIDRGTLFFNTLRDGKFYCASGHKITIGSDAEIITAVLPTTQSSLAIYKENGFYILSLDGEGQGELFPSPDILGCLSRFCATRLNDECLALGVGGIYGIKDAKSRNNISTQQAIRSAPIQAELDQINENAKRQGVSCVHKGKYYIFLENGAYVAQKNEDKDDFVWWRFDDCDARVVLSSNGMLYMGRENGDVAIFDDGYTDRRDYVLNERERDFLFKEGEKTTVSFNYAIGVEEGDRVSLEEHYALWSRCVLDYRTNRICMSEADCFENGVYIAPCQGEKVLLTSLQGELVYEGIVADIIPSELAIHCVGIGIGEDMELLIYRMRDERVEYTLKIEGGLNYLYLDARPLCLYSTEIDHVYLRDTREIECEIYTPVTDLEESGEKTLMGIVVALSSDTRCCLELGYDTGKGRFHRQFTVGSNMDFRSLDFNDFNFNTQFKRAIKIKCVERGFDYIRLWLRSQGGEKFGVDSISMLYRRN